MTNKNYKKSVVAAYAKRAITHNDNWEDIHEELDRIRQLLTNNGYRDQMIESVISRKLDTFINQDRNKNTEKDKNLVIYHRLDYNTHFREDADVLRRIVKRGVTPIQPFDKLSLRIYCRSPKVSGLLMRNSTVEKKWRIEKETNVVYHFRCNVDACQRHKSNYIGHTTQTLRKRLSQHRNKGAINEHYKDIHNRLPKVEKLIENTKIIHRESIRYRLLISEAVSIAPQKPTLNVQAEFDYVLPSCRSRPNLDNSTDAPPPFNNAPVTAPPPAAAPVDVARAAAARAPSAVDQEQENEATTRGAQHVRRLRPLPHRRM